MDIKKIAAQKGMQLFCILFCVLVISCGGNKNKQTVYPVVTGKVLPDWSEGYLDIHHINTGRGESALYIFPDGTTMLVDASSSLIAVDHDIPPPPAKPNAAAVSGQTISNYVSHFIKAAENKLNYILITHWHEDHIGGYDTSLPEHSSGKFRLTGVTQVGANIWFDKIIDRGYIYPTDISSNDNIVNYIKFVNWAKEEYTATTEEFKVGVTDQFALVRNPVKYADFQIRNIFANGIVWTGSGIETRNTFPPASGVAEVNPNENHLCCAFHLKYGLFDYFAGADLQYNNRSVHAWLDVEAPIAEVMQPVEVLKANHHGTNHCNSDVFLNKLKSDVIIIPVWRDVQPNPSTISRMFDANSECEIFTTNMTEKNKSVLGAETISRIKALNGHIVVRVAPGGNSYFVYVLDDTNENYIVKKIFGPYQCN